MVLGCEMMLVAQYLCKVGVPPSLGVDMASSSSSDLLTASITPFLAWSMEARSDDDMDLMIRISVGYS
jgi:hypothetical protein